MSKNKNIDLSDVLSPKTQANIAGVIIGDDLKQTIDLNINRLNKNTGDYYTPTIIIFNYVRFVNNTHLIGETNKFKYLFIAETLLKELNNAGFFIGKDWSDSSKLPLTKGNSKLSNDTVIINLSPASLCISHNNGMCDVCGVCYALSSERRYINSLIFRLTQLIRFEELTIESISNQILRLKNVNWLRVNESGDIFNLDDAIKLLKIAGELYERKGIRTYLYTHRADLFDYLKGMQTPYFKVNRSQVDFIANKKIESNHPSLFCDGNCKYCIYCKLELNTPIDALYHGDLIGDDLRDVKTRKRDLTLKWECYKMFNAGCDADEITSHIHQTLFIDGDD